MSEQPNAESLADRIAAQFEPDEQPEEQEGEQQEEGAAEQPESEEPAQPDVVDVDFGGKSYKVPPELKDALMAQSDYTRKTTEVAEQARLIEHRAQQFKAAESEKAFHASVKDDIAQAQKLDYQLEQYKNMDVTGLTSDQLWQVSRQIDKLKDDRQKVVDTINQKHNQWQADMAVASKDALAKAHEVAAKIIPNWSAETQKQVRDYASANGFTSDEIAGITDPRIVKVLWQATQFEKLQKAKTNGRVTTTPAVKPGSSNPMPQGVKNHFQFKKEMKSAPNSSAKAKVIEKELMRRFS